MLSNKVLWLPNYNVFTNIVADYVHLLFVLLLLLVAEYEPMCIITICHVQGTTPLHIAAANATSHIVQAMVEAGADVTTADAKAST